MYKRGLIIGKFMPLHKGHEFLFRFGKQCCQNLTIVVDNAKSHTIDSGIRRDWIRELVSGAHVLALPHFMPQTPDECENFWETWKTELLKIAGPVDVLIASEDYGVRLAKELGCEFIQLDLNRENINISATQIRDNPYEHWDFIAEPAREFFMKKICFIGPEATGKSTLSKKLASSFDTVVAQEYAKSYIHQKKSDLVFSDMSLIAKRQIYVEKSLCRMVNKIMFCDSDPLTTAVWSQTLFGTISFELKELVLTTKYDLTFLMYPDTPWVWDEHRNFEKSSTLEFRLKMFENMKQFLDQIKRNYIVLYGSYEEKEKQALKAIAYYEAKNGLMLQHKQA